MVAGDLFILFYFYVGKFIRTNGIVAGHVLQCNDGNDGDVLESTLYKLPLLLSLKLFMETPPRSLSLVPLGLH